MTRFYEGHSHPLASPKSAIFLKENRNMTSIQKTFVTKAARMKLARVRVLGAGKSYQEGMGM